MSASQRVFLVDGQAVYLEGDGDVTEDVLQQALAQLTAGGGGVQAIQQPEPEPESETEPKTADQTMDSQEGIVLSTDDAGDEEEGVLAILQDETGQQQTVRLTPDQAAALGIDYQQLLAAAAGGDESDAAAAGAGEEEAAAEPAAGTSSGTSAPVPAEQTSAQEVASLASSVVLNLNESQPSLVNQSQGGDKVTYTFEVMDKDSEQQAQHQAKESSLLTKTRDIMVPRVKTGDTRQIQQQIHRTAAQVLRTSTPSAPIPRDPVTGGYVSSSTLKKGPVYNTGPNALPSKVRRTVINTASTVQQKLPSSSSASSSLPPTATTATGDRSAVDMEEDVDDLPVILTPVTEGEPLPDFIEPRPGLKILVRPLDMDAGGGDGPGTASGTKTGTPGRAVGSSENPIQLVQQGNTFKSLQPLSREQLKQIATVLQQSRLNVPSNSKNSLYDADTNTRIVYRVVYPEDVSRGGGGRGRGRRGRPRGRGYYSRKNYDADNDWSPELSRYEKAERKRLATKTRTGRVSKPPKHMVKDYRRIHRLDFDEPDMDDSDGGYSEYDETLGEDDLTVDSTELSNDASATGDGSAAGADGGRLEPETAQEAPPKPKRPMAQALRDRFTCRTCNSLCIGYMRLEQHFAKFPDHERPVYVPPKTPMRRPYGRPGGWGPGWTRGRGRGRGRAARGAYVPTAQRLAKRPRPDTPEPDPSDISAEAVLSQLISQSNGNVEDLCESMSAVLEEFRHHVQTAVTPAQVGERPAGMAASGAADGPVLKIDEERSFLTGLPTGTYVLWPLAPAPDDAGESVSDFLVPAESPAAAEPAAASPSVSTALDEAVMAAVSGENSPSSAVQPEQGADAAIREQTEPPPAAQKSEPASPEKERTPPPPESDKSNPEEPKPRTPGREKDVLSAAEISQMALSATEGTQMPAEDVPAAVPAPYPETEGGGAELAADPPPAPLPATNGRTLPLSESEAAHRAVSDVLDEFVDGLVDPPDYTFTAEPVPDVDSAQMQLKLADPDAAAAATAASSAEMPLLEDGR